MILRSVGTDQRVDEFPIDDCTLSYRRGGPEYGVPLLPRRLSGGATKEGPKGAQCYKGWAGVPEVTRERVGARVQGGTVWEERAVRPAYLGSGKER